MTSNPRIVAIVQARMGSTRLAGKSLVDICGKPLLARILERISVSTRLDAIVVATTTAPEDEAIRQLAASLGFASYAGSAEDVLDRYYQAAVAFSAGVIVRVTADDPFKDPVVMDRIIDHFLCNPQLDYASNTIIPSFPEGLDIEVFSFRALKKAWEQARLSSEREHVTPYIWRHPEAFALANVACDTDLSRLRWTLDYEQDLRFARAVYEALGQRGVFLMNDILALLAAKPELSMLNDSLERNLGYKASLAHEAIVGASSERIE